MPGAGQHVAADEEPRRSRPGDRARQRHYSGRASPASTRRSAAVCRANSTVSFTAGSRGRGSSIGSSSFTRPGRAPSTSTRSERNTASGELWVTNRIVVPGRLPDAQQLLVHVLAGDLVERAERLVHQQDLRPRDERPRDRDPLPHPARQLPGIGLLEAAEPDQLEQRQRVGAGPGARRRRSRAAAARSAARSARAGAWSPGRRSRTRDGGARRPAARRRPRCVPRSAPGCRRRGAARWTCRSRRGPAARRTRAGAIVRLALASAWTGPAGVENVIPTPSTRIPAGGGAPAG